jgi:hypothetical protein
MKHRVTLDVKAELVNINLTMFSGTLTGAFESNDSESALRYAHRRNVSRKKSEDSKDEIQKAHSVLSRTSLDVCKYKSRTSEKDVRIQTIKEATKSKF